MIKAAQGTHCVGVQQRFWETVEGSGITHAKPLQTLEQEIEAMLARPASQSTKMTTQ